MSKVFTVKPMQMESYDVLSDKHRYRPFVQKGWRRSVQRLCFWVLDWLGCRDFDVEWDVTELDTISLLPAILEQVHTARRLGISPDILLVGRDHQIKMRNEAMSYLCQFQLPQDNYYMPRELFGLRVVCVPWMNGIVVLPKTCVE